MNYFEYRYYNDSSSTAYDTSTSYTFIGDSTDDSFYEIYFFEPKKKSVEDLFNDLIESI